MQNISCLAIDMGASNIRLIHGLIGDQIQLKELHRFDNKITFRDGHDRWDLNAIKDQISLGLKKAVDINLRVDSVGVDSWGVDFVLLGREGEPVEDPVAYRDSRTENMRETWLGLMTESQTYQRTGINFYPFNTLFQLLSLKNSDILEQTQRILFMPDYINYYLSGVLVNELTISSTTQMLNTKSKDWDTVILDHLKLKPGLFEKPTLAGIYLGDVKPTFGLKAKNILVPGHDSANAVLAIPKKTNNYVFLLTGTWCIIGMESELPLLDDLAFNEGITNEMTVSGTYRPLKNIMGLWLVQKLREVFDPELSYSEIDRMAANETPAKYLIDPDDSRFYNPENMKIEFDKYLQEKCNARFEKPAEYFRCAYESLSQSFMRTIKALEKLRNKKFECIHITGGGAQSELLCQLTANVSGLTVYSGPTEGAALGNIISQAKSLGFFKDDNEISTIINHSFSTKTYKPEKL